MNSEDESQNVEKESKINLIMGLSITVGTLIIIILIIFLRKKQQQKNLKKYKRKVKYITKQQTAIKKKNSEFLNKNNQSKSMSMKTFIEKRLSLTSLKLENSDILNKQSFNKTKNESEITISPFNFNKNNKILFESRNNSHKNSNISKFTTDFQVHPSGSNKLLLKENFQILQNNIHLKKKFSDNKMKYCEIKLSDKLNINFDLNSSLKDDKQSICINILDKEDN
jgi:hypothetical protein